MFPNWVTQLFRNALKLSCSIYTRMLEDMLADYTGVFMYSNNIPDLGTTAATNPSSYALFCCSVSSITKISQGSGKMCESQGFRTPHSLPFQKTCQLGDVTSPPMASVPLLLGQILAHRHTLNNMSLCVSVLQSRRTRTLRTSHGDLVVSDNITNFNQPQTYWSYVEAIL